MSKTNSLRCPLCGKGRIADIPSGAEQSQYRLFALHRAEHPDLITKCPKWEGKYGKFLACSNYPKCKNTRAVNEVKSEEKCPKCGEQIGITVLTPDAHPLIHTPIPFMGYVQA